MPRRHPCDVCTHPRKRWQRLCETCFRVLPPAKRTAIIEAHRRADRRAKRIAIRDAIQFLGEAVTSHMRAVTARDAYVRTAAMMGEHEL